MDDIDPEKKGQKKKDERNHNSLNLRLFQQVDKHIKRKYDDDSGIIGVNFMSFHELHFHSALLPIANNL